MTVSSTVSKQSFNGSGSTGPFTFNFQIRNAENIVVYKVDSLGVESTLVSPGDYSLVLLANGISGGSITLTSALAVGERLTVVRSTPLTQDIRYSNQGAFFPETHERSFDKAAMIDQELSEKVSRCLSLPPTTQSTGIGIDDPVGDAVLVWSADGKRIVNGPSTGQIGDASQAALDAIAAKDAAEAAASAAETSETNAGNSASDAWTAANQAEDDADDAADAATSASSSATAAGNSATSAGNSATIASSAATTATNQATAAGNSATAAGSSATSAANNAAISIQYAQGLPSEPSGGSAKFWAESMAHIIVTPEQYGAVGYTGTDSADYVNDTTAIQAMLDQAPIGSRVYLTKTYGTTTFANNRGLIFEGPGEIVSYISGTSLISAGYYRRNTGADHLRDVFGEENLYRVHWRMRQSGNRVLTCFAYGDSTLANPGTISNARNYIENAFRNACNNAGLPAACSIVNRAVPGDDISDFDPSADLTSATDLIFIKYGLNEGAGALPAGRPDNLLPEVDEWVEELRSKLAGIRASYPMKDLSIIILGPNAANNTGYRDMRWLEPYVKAMRAAAREYQCCYFDMKDRWLDAVRAGDLWLDPVATYGPLHPTDIGWSMMWAAFGAWWKEIIPQDIRSNTVVAPVPWASAPGVSNVPSAYECAIGVHRTGSGLASGTLLSVFDGARQRGFQMLYGEDSRIYYRKKDPASDAWGSFRTATALTLQNGWTNLSASVPAQNTSVLSCFMLPDGTVRLEGVIVPGTLTVNTVIATLPTECRPTKNKWMSVQLATAAGSHVVTIRTSGEIVIGVGAMPSTSWVSFDGMSFHKDF